MRIILHNNYKVTQYFLIKNNIALAIEGGLLGYKMYKNGQEFYGGEGIVTKGVENTIKNIGHLGHEGMKETDKEIIRIMTGL